MDPEHPAPLTSYPNSLKVAIISVGDAADDRSYWNRLSTAPFLLNPVSEREGHVLVDFRDPQWQRLLLKEIIPQALSQGFNGLLLDNLDSLLEAESRDPQRLSGQRDSLTHWLMRLRDTYPKILIMAKGSRALEVAAPYVDAYVGEGIFTVWDPSYQKARRTTVDERDTQLKRLENASAVEARPIFCIEVTDVNQADLGQWAMTQSKKRGFRPFLKIR